MTKPLVVSLPHRLGRTEATRRLKNGLTSVRTQLGAFFVIQEETWSGDHLSFRVTALKQDAVGTIDVSEDQVRVEVTLPWLLGRFAHGAQTLIQQRGALMLEKK
jgi:Putative polyhydroxyalkanoic acid system protein (PHA_gran_rgn)